MDVVEICNLKKYFGEGVNQVKALDVSVFPLRKANLQQLSAPLVLEKLHY